MKKMSVYLGFHHFLIGNIGLKAWCEKYEIEPFTAACCECGSQLEVIHPFIAKNRRGLRANPCACGNHHVPFTYIDLEFNDVNLNSLGTITENSSVQDSKEKIQTTHPHPRLVECEFKEFHR